MREVVIVSAVRTPIGAFGGKLMGFSAAQLGKIAAVEAIKRAGIKPEQVEDVVMGNVLQAGLGQNVARQVSVHAGIPVETPAMTINRVCGSGLQAVGLAAQSIMLGDADVVLCGGTESMSNAAHVTSSARWGTKMGDIKLVDTMLCDGLTDAFSNSHMGITAENIAREYGLTREQQDEFAVWSQNKAEAAIKAGKFADEIVPVEIPQRKGDPVVFDTDEFPRFGSTMDAMAKLRPAFEKDGTVTAGNASGINDGAACLIVMAKEKAQELGLEWLAEFKGFAAAGCKPEVMGLGPIPATRKVLQKLSMDVKDLDLIEANEAFAAQSLAVANTLGFNKDMVNVNGGAIALGHPIGASGARILVTLLHEMVRRDAKNGLATLCIGGGQGVSLVVGR